MALCQNKISHNLLFYRLNKKCQEYTFNYFVNYLNTKKQKLIIFQVQTLYYLDHFSMAFNNKG